jgi:DNA-binding phage protein
MIKISAFDSAKYLNSPQAMADYLSEALATGNTEFIHDALDVVDRAKGRLRDQLSPAEPLSIAKRDNQD